MVTKNGNVLYKNILSTIGVLALLGGILVTVTVSAVATRYDILDIKKDIATERKARQAYIDSKTSDRWRKTNDKLFMEDYSRTNGLKMVQHRIIAD